MPIPAVPSPFSSSIVAQGFQGTLPPTTSGVATRSIPDERIAYRKRSVMRWFVPEVGIVDMYVNPEMVSYKDSKTISSERSKGGFILQYYGEDFTELSLSGTTGSSGIEGINVLYDVYRAEQVAFDPYALLIAKSIEEQREESQRGGLVELGANSVISFFANQFQNTTGPVKPSPTLASLAFSVELYWSGWVYRGFFENFTLTENADQPGLFKYDMNFKAFQRRGYRYNFMPYHRSATAGQSDSDPYFGVPYSYKDLGASPISAAPEIPTISAVAKLSDQLKTAGGFIEDIF
jgi:hypothetical protein